MSHNDLGGLTHYEEKEEAIKGEIHNLLQMLDQLNNQEDKYFK